MFHRQGISWYPNYATAVAPSRKISYILPEPPIQQPVLPRKLVISKKPREPIFTKDWCSKYPDDRPELPPIEDYMGPWKDKIPRNTYFFNTNTNKYQINESVDLKYENWFLVKSSCGNKYFVPQMICTDFQDKIWIPVANNERILNNGLSYHFNIWDKVSPVKPNQ